MADGQTSFARKLTRGRFSGTSIGRPVVMSIPLVQFAVANSLAEMSWPVFRFRT